MVSLTELAIATVLIPVLDAPWLLYQGSQSQSMFSKIQGGAPVSMKLWPAVVVYLALAYLLLQQTSVLGAALHGSAVYAVYDFTNLAVFKDYKVSFAVADTLWGGVLFAAAYWVLEKIRKAL